MILSRSSDAEGSGKMSDENILTMLKIDLGIMTDAYDERLAQYITAAKAQIAREGATLTDSMEDTQLVSAYAAWQWRKRDSGEGMPRMVRWMLNNRIMSEKAGGTDG